ncbi:MAG: hypothetical protein GY792_18310 [Gammaproteobacteria bacterium]|nr:hypothetical protein [Gammaproteobacteria bacterium]
MGIEAFGILLDPASDSDTSNEDLLADLQGLKLAKLSPKATLLEWV